MKDWFRKFARLTAVTLGSPYAFITGILVMISVIVIGLVFRSTPGLRLSLNMTPSAIAFLIVLIIQNTQNRHSDAIQLKLDEIIVTLKGDPNLIEVEKLPEEQLNRLADRIDAYRKREEAKGNVESTEMD